MGLFQCGQFILSVNVRNFRYVLAAEYIIFNIDTVFKTGCDVNYHNNYRVHQGRRIYYDGIPCILQIGEHQFAEIKLVNMWIAMMLLSWTSATNCARIYNMVFSSYSINWNLAGWQFNLEVTSDQVYNSFTIISLLEDCQLQKATLVVPHGGPAKERFTEAVRGRNNRFRLSSQPALFHYCKKCTRFYAGMFYLQILLLKQPW